MVVEKSQLVIISVYLQKKIAMAPTVFKHKGYRFFFFSAEEKRRHVHVVSNGAEAKFWIEPDVKMAVNNGFNIVEINGLEKIIKQNENKIRNFWDKHFGG
jgi:hypothetical protein